MAGLQSLLLVSAEAVLNSNHSDRGKVEPFHCLLLAGDPEASLVALGGTDVPTHLTLRSEHGGPHCHFSLTMLDSLLGDKLLISKLLFLKGCLLESEIMGTVLTTLEEIMAILKQFKSRKKLFSLVEFLINIVCADVR